MLKYLLKTFAFDANASNLTHEYLFENFNKIIYQNIAIKNAWVKLDASNRRYD